ncbi:MAG: hypothetical protein ACE5GJ_10745 [Gemmatimonadota bacterium]
MKARFRIRVGEGEELRPATLEEFAAMVEAGAVSDHDLVYDELTGEWAPAHAHLIYRLVHDPLVSGPKPPPESSGGPTDGRGGSSSGGPGVEGAHDDGAGLTIVPHSVPSPEEEARAFVEEMRRERERERDPDRPPIADELPLVGGDALHRVDRRTEPRHPGEPQGRPAAQQGCHEAPASPASASPASASPAPATSAGSRAAPAADASGARSAGSAGAPTSAPRGSAGPVGRPAGWWVMGILLAAGGVVGLMGSRSRAVEGHPSDTVWAVRTPGPHDPLAQAAWTEFRERLQAPGFAMADRRVPRAWLSGPYLSKASRFPQVRAFWLEVRGALEELHDDEDSLFTAAAAQAAVRQGLEGPMLTLRLARVRRAFAAGEEERLDAYGRLWDVAVAALHLHDVLLRLEDRLMYEPARGKKLSSAPVLEVAGTDPRAQEEMEAALDRVLAALVRAGLSGSTENGGAVDADVGSWLRRLLPEDFPGGHEENPGRLSRPGPSR